MRPPNTNDLYTVMSVLREQSFDTGLEDVEVDSCNHVADWLEEIIEANPHKLKITNVPL